MANYDFSTLNPTDFEKLVCDLLNHSHRDSSEPIYVPFKEGKDQGIDLLQSDFRTRFKTVVQVKHYLKTPFSTLLRDLKVVERVKISKISPERYIIVTSKALSPSDKIKIMDGLKPYIFSLSDILGRDDINALIAIHNIIEERHYKLWFSGTIALKKIMNYKYSGRKGEFTEEEIKRKLRLFVSTKEVDYAQNLLDTNKFVVITGDPGVGKTTLSEVLIYKYLAKDYDLTVIYDNIREVEDTLVNDDSSQIFYYDDFLGHTQAEIDKCKSAEISLLKIVSRIEKLKNKYLILNTRRFILNSLLEESERLRDFNILRGESKIELQAYSYGAKRRMLDNHTAESQLGHEQLDVIRNNAFFICNHRNFTPRHTEFFTSKKHVGTYSPDTLKAFIEDNLENPKKIWQHAYNEQIADRERFFLNTMYSLNGMTQKAIMEKAYMTRINYEVNNSNYFRTQQPFSEAVQRLNEGFTTVSVYGESKFYFINPSLEDFLRFHIDDNPYEIQRILYSAININQWYFFYKPFDDKKKEPDNTLMDYFCTVFTKILKSPEELYQAVIFISCFNPSMSLQAAIILKQIHTWEFLLNNPSLVKYSFDFIKAVKGNPILNYSISKLNPQFLFVSLLSCQTIEEIIELVDLFRNHYGYNLPLIFENNSSFYGLHKLSIKKIYEHCVDIFSNEIDHQYNVLMKNVDINLHYDTFQRIDHFHQYFVEYIFFNFSYDYSLIKEPQWEQIAETNYSDHLTFGSPDDYDSYHEEHDEYYYDEYEDDYNFEEERQVFNYRLIDIRHDDLPF